MSGMASSTSFHVVDTTIELFFHRNAGRGQTPVSEFFDGIF